MFHSAAERLGLCELCQMAVLMAHLQNVFPLDAVLAAELILTLHKDIAQH